MHRAASLRLADPHDKALELPDTGTAAYLAAYWLELGQCSVSGFGPAPLSYLEIQAWQRATGLDLEPWEILTLRRMSDAYCRELNSAAEATAIAPTQQDDTDQQRRKVDAALRAFAKVHDVSNKRPGNAHGSRHQRRHNTGDQRARQTGAVGAKD